MSRAVTTSSTDQSIRVWAYNSSGVAITGEAYNSPGIAVSVVVRSAGRILSTTSLTLVARSSVGVHRDSAFTEVGGGEYVVDLPDSYSATANRQVSVTLTSTAISGGYVLSETLDVGVRAELDSSSRLAIWNTLTTETFTADSFGELLLISDGTNGRAVKVTGANHIAADVHDCQADGLSGSTEIANIQDSAGWLLAIGSGAVANPQTSTEQYDITQFGVNYRVAMAGLTSTGTRTAPTLSKP
jgi:hypothetical protein